MLGKLLQFVGLVGAAFLAVLLFTIVSDVQEMQDVAYVRQESIEQAAATSSMTDATSEPVETTAIQAETQPAAAAQSQNTDTGTEVRRIRDPYTFPQKTDTELYAATRAAIVNIYCESRGPVGSISGSGVVIDAKGVILTNAHVAQYMLLAGDSTTKTECFIRTGSPSQNRYKADIVYLPSIWIDAHASDIAAKRPTGTGEHDYALLLITKTIDGSPLPSAFPYLPFDTRESIAFTSDTVLLAGYPAEFAIQSQRGSTLYPTSVFTRIGELFTFTDRSIDLIALGGAVIAQSGASGGAVVNEWGQLVGIISTTSDGATTAERELRALTLSYIDRDLWTQNGKDLASLVASDLIAETSLFMNVEAPVLKAKLAEYLH